MTAAALASAALAAVAAAVAAWAARRSRTARDQADAAHLALAAVAAAAQRERLQVDTLERQLAAELREHDALKEDAEYLRHQLDSRERELSTVKSELAALKTDRFAEATLYIQDIRVVPAEGPTGHREYIAVVDHAAALKMTSDLPVRHRGTALPTDDGGRLEAPVDQLAAMIARDLIRHLPAHATVIDGDADWMRTYIERGGEIE